MFALIVKCGKAASESVLDPAHQTWRHHGTAVTNGFEGRGIARFLIMRIQQGYDHRQDTQNNRRIFAFDQAIDA
jgi:hypothetical protein